MSGSSVARRHSAAGWLLFSVSAVMATVADLWTKHWIFGRLGMPGVEPPITVVPGMLQLRTNLNEGALFGVGQGLGLVFAAVSLVALAGIGVMVSRTCLLPRGARLPAGDLLTLDALGMITGGILGNLYDRLGLPGLIWHFPPERVGEPVKAVRDWIHFAIDGVIDWPIFNLADSFLVVGAGILLIASLFHSRPCSLADEACSASDSP
jgi:signal peptidase II